GDKKNFEESLVIACENNEGFSESSIIKINYDCPIFQGMNPSIPQNQNHQPLYTSNNDNLQSNFSHQQQLPNTFDNSQSSANSNLCFQQSCNIFDDPQYNVSHQQFFPNVNLNFSQQPSNNFVEPQFNVTQPLDYNSFSRLQNYNTYSYNPLNLTNNQ
ncbi:4338_t:CDS:2, partial [Entrophospora sp. SA101]